MDTLIYKGNVFKVIHRGRNINKYINSKGLIISCYKSGVIKESYGSYNRGYLVTSSNLFSNNSSNLTRVHRLVMFCFGGEKPKGKDFVDHIDTNRKNNSVENLRWCTQYENNNNPITKKKRSYSNKKPMIVYLEDGKVLMANSRGEMAKKLGIKSASCISDWISKRRPIPKKYNIKKILVNIDLKIMKKHIHYKKQEVA